MFRRTVPWVVSIAACFSLFGCSKGSAPPAPRIALVSDVAGFADHAFNQDAAGGITRCAETTGAQTTLLASKAAGDYEANFNLLATEGYDLVVGVGGAMSHDLIRSARHFEGTHFAIVNGYVPEPNVASFTFKDQDAGFVAGALAALFSRSKRVAFLGGVESAVPVADRTGFVAGAREVDPRVSVTVRYVGSFGDSARAAALARSLYGAGNDVIFVVAGPAGVGALDAARRTASGYAIGVDADEDGIAPGKVLASVIKRIDLAVLRACLDAVAQKPASGETQLGLADGAIALSDFRYTRKIVGTARLARLVGIERAVASGAIVPPSTDAALQSFRPLIVP